MSTPRVAVIISISLVLFLMGILGLFLIYSNRMGESVKENLSAALVLKEGMGKAEAITLVNKIKSEVYVRDSKIIDAADAAEIMKNELGEDFVSFIGYNPLSTVVEVYFTSALGSPELIQAFAARMEKDGLVKEVRVQTGLLQKLEHTTRRVSYAFLVLSLLLLLVSTTLIYQSIRISIYSRRFSIKTMQLVGATRWFILRPFVQQGMWDGLTGGLVALALVSGTWLAARRNIPGLSDLDDPLKMEMLVAGILLMGLIISIFSTIFALSRFLKSDPDKLY